jgi:hypothetical protein
VPRIQWEKRNGTEKDSEPGASLGPAAFLPERIGQHYPVGINVSCALRGFMIDG